MKLAPIPVASLTCAEFRTAARRLVPRGHGAATRLYRHLLATGRLTPEELDLSVEASSAYHQHFCLDLPEVTHVVTEDIESGTTAKATLTSGDGLEYECVFLPMGRGRATLCISSQVGCKMGCEFCETGRMGLLRNLSTAEIVGQLLVARCKLGWTFSNVVFMGMGEALDNADAVIDALRVMSDSGGLAIGLDHITVCTVGNVAGLQKLRAAGFTRLNVSVSLNAANDALRDTLMPINRRTPLAELQRALVAYRPRTNFAFGINYCLMPGINDSIEDIANIAEFCAPLGRVMVNVIPYNPGTIPIARQPTEREVVNFIHALREAGLAVRRRITKGRSVMAACGQLGNIALREEIRAQRRRLRVTE